MARDDRSSGAALSRRFVLHRTAALGAAALSARVLAACGGAGGGQSATSGTGGDPVVNDRPGGPVNQVDISEEDGFRVVRSNGIPPHRTGKFPNLGCPAPIRPQTHNYRMTLTPAPAADLTPLHYWELGVATNGVPFDPAGPFWRGDDASGWQFEVMSPTARTALGLDRQNAHVQPTGAYHYHGLGRALAAQAELDRTARKMSLAGWAADGFPIYSAYGHEEPFDPESPLVALRPSYRLREGSRRTGPGGRFDGTMVADFELVEGLGDLDAANGRMGVTPEYPQGTYHYMLTVDFPFIPRFYRGTPDRSFARPHGPGLAGVPPALLDYEGR